MAAIIARQADDAQHPSGPAENGNKIVAMGATLLRTIIKNDRLGPPGSLGTPRLDSSRQIPASMIRK